MMIRLSTVCGILLSVFLGSYLFHVKYQVNTLEKELHKTYRKIAQSQQSIHILKAEWTYLNEPKRLQNLAHKHLSIRPTDPAQLVVIQADGKLQRHSLRQDLKTSLAAYRSE